MSVAADKIDSIDILVTVWVDDSGFYNSRASTPIGVSSVKHFNEPRIVTDICPSRSKERAIAYALTELAVKLSAGR